MTEPTIRQRVHRPPATCTWEHHHQWGASLGDGTDLRVSRVSDGGLTISYGKDSIEIRAALVDVLAGMVAKASTWSDES